MTPEETAVSAGLERAMPRVSELRTIAEGRVVGERFRTLRLLKSSQGIDSWLADDLSGSGQVVLKTLAAATVPRSVQHRLEHEATVLRELDSRYLTGLLHVGRDEGLLFFAVPFVPGLTLEQRLQSGPLPPAQAIQVGCCLLAALEEAHAHG